jgi:hypothetical protein
LHFDSLDVDEVKALAGLWMQVVVRQLINVLASALATLKLTLNHT